MFTVTIKHRGDDKPTDYKVYKQDEMDSKEKEYVYWKEAREGDWALSDDGFCAKVLKRTKYPNDRGTHTVYLRLPWGYFMWNPKYPNKKFCAGGRSANNTFTGKRWIEVANNTEPFKALAMWAALTEDRDVAIDQVFGPVSAGKRRKLRRHMRTESFKAMKRDEAQRLLTDKMMDANFFIDLMNEGIEMAKDKKDVNAIRGFVNDGMEIHGMKDKDVVTTTEKLEAVQTRKLIDNINQEEEKLIATRQVKEPVKEIKNDTLDSDSTGT